MAGMQPKRIQKKIKTEIILGSPSSGCQGVGICRVMAHGDKRQFKCPKVTAWITKTKTGMLRFSFLKSDMDPRFVRRHFGWMLFQVYEAYELPGGIAHALGLNEILVQPGIYTVWETPRFLTVDF
jgi:hypothetical protein